MPKEPANFSTAHIWRGPYPIKDAGVDWLTVSCRQSDTQSLFDEIGYTLLHVEAEAGAKVKPWKFENFEGLNAGMCAVGKRDDMSLIRLSSACAWSNWRRVFELATNCSRIDFQVTVRDVPDVDQLILSAHKSALDRVSAMKRPYEVDLRLSNRRGPTLYLGVRQSQRFGRFYNKFRESKLAYYERCARAELQVNGKAAIFAGKVLLQSGRDPHDVIPYISHFFSRRGVIPCWPDCAAHQIYVPRRRGNASSRLRWLRDQVRPALQSLADEGHMEEALEALGLNDRFTIAR